MKYQMLKVSLGSMENDHDSVCIIVSCSPFIFPSSYIYYSLKKNNNLQGSYTRAHTPCTIIADDRQKRKKLAIQIGNLGGGGGGGGGGQELIRHWNKF